MIFAARRITGLERCVFMSDRIEQKQQGIHEGCAGSILNQRSIHYASSIISSDS